MIRALTLWLPVALYMGVIFHLSAQSDVSIPAGLNDKASHWIAYTGLGLLFVRALAGGLGERVTAVTVLLGIALTVAYGASDEFHQWFVPARTADLRDLGADAIGGATGAALCWLWSIISPAPRDFPGSSRHGF